MGDTFPRNRRIVRRFRQDEAALQHRLDMPRQIGRSHARRRAIGVDRRLDVGGQRVAIGGDARFAGEPDRLAGRIGVLHHRADEADEAVDRAVKHREAEIDMAEQSVERILELRVRQHLEHRPRALGPGLGGRDRQRFLRGEMVKEGALGDARRGADIVDARRGVALPAHGRVRRRDQRRPRTPRAARPLGAGPGRAAIGSGRRGG